MLRYSVRFSWTETTNLVKYSRLWHARLKVHSAVSSLKSVYFSNRKFNPLICFRSKPPPNLGVNITMEALALDPPPMIQSLPCLRSSPTRDLIDDRGPRALQQVSKFLRLLVVYDIPSCNTGKTVSR